MQILAKLTFSIFMFSNNFFIIFFLTYIKVSKDSWAKYYQKKNERWQKKACQRYKSLSKEEKEKKQQYGLEQYKNLPDDEKEKLAEYRKKYYKMRKTPCYNYKKLFVWKIMTQKFILMENRLTLNIKMF